MRNVLRQVNDGTFLPFLPMCIMSQAIEPIIFVATISQFGSGFLWSMKGFLAPTLMVVEIARVLLTACDCINWCEDSENGCIN
jgi:hypothetical protein